MLWVKTTGYSSSDVTFLTKSVVSAQKKHEMSKIWCHFLMMYMCTRDLSLSCFGIYSSRTISVIQFHPCPANLSFTLKRRFYL